MINYLSKFFDLYLQIFIAKVVINVELVSKTKLRDCMIAKGWGVRQLSKVTKINSASISLLLKKNSLVRLPTLAKLIQAFECHADDLLMEV